jgi:Uri superfamily endonuclease
MCDECEPCGIFEGKGAYMLLISLSKAREITVGSLGKIPFQPGGYAYVGSAQGGLKGRIGYHLKKNKKPRRP